MDDWAWNLIGIAFMLVTVTAVVGIARWRGNRAARSLLRGETAAAIEDESVER